MSKRLLIFTIVLLLLAVTGTAYGQEPTAGELIFTLTEAQINDEFTIPSTAFYSVSDVEVDVQPDGIHITLEVVDAHDGTSNTMGIIAILIGLVQDNRVSYSFYDILISSFDVRPSDATVRELGRLVRTAWQSYANNALRQSGIALNSIRLTDVLMEDEGIFLFGTERQQPGPGWCVQCPKG